MDLRLEMRTGFERVRAEMEGVRAEMARTQSSTIRWLLAFSVPMWAGTWGTIVAVLVSN